jgi:N-acetylglucosamine-6-phosphate deacetylase
VIDGQITTVDVVVEGAAIVDIVAPDTPDDGAEMIDCSGLVVAPGFIDLQCNGANAIDITNQPERIIDVATELPRFGVTSFLPTVVTAAAHTRAAAITTMTELRRRRRAPGTGIPYAQPLGLHFEGPMISREHLGAHPARFVTDPAAMLEEIQEWTSSGVVAMVTLAPELDGALAVVGRLAAGGVIVSAGHTATTPSDFARARTAGLSYVTHLYNAMAPFGHRAPGPIGAALADRDVVVGVICDGIHVDPVAVEMAWRALGPARTSLVSDASPALGAPYGRVDLGGFQIVHDATGVRTNDGVLAGSALPLDRAVRNLVEFTNCSLADAVATVTSTPADLLGLDDRGRLTIGARADLTLLDHGGHLHRTVVAGDLAWASEPAAG